MVKTLSNPKNITNRKRIRTIHEIENPEIRKELIEKLTKCVKDLADHYFCKKIGKGEAYLRGLERLKGIERKLGRSLDLPFLHRKRSLIHGQFIDWTRRGFNSLVSQYKKEIGEGTYFGPIAKYQKRFLEGDIKLVPELNEAIKGKTLEIGCNVGWFVKLLRDSFGSDSHGLDTNEDALALGRFFGVKNLESRMPYKKLQYKKESFDAVLSIGSLYEVFSYKPEKIVEMLKPQGLLVLYASNDFIADKHLKEHPRFKNIYRYQDMRVYHGIDVWRKTGED